MHDRIDFKAEMRTMAERVALRLIHEMMFGKKTQKILFDKLKLDANTLSVTKKAFEVLYAMDPATGFPFTKRFLDYGMGAEKAQRFVAQWTDKVLQNPEGFVEVLDTLETPSDFLALLGDKLYTALKE